MYENCSFDKGVIHEQNACRLDFEINKKTLKFQYHFVFFSVRSRFLGILEIYSYRIVNIYTILVLTVM